MGTETNQATAPTPPQPPITPDFLLALNAANTGYAITELAETISAAAGMLGWDHVHAVAEQIKRFAQVAVHEIGQRIHAFEADELGPAPKSNIIIIPGGGM